MTDERLTQDQLTQLVAEVDQLARRHEAEIDRQEIQQILQELNLPPELLDEALIQLSRRQALAVQQKRNRWIGIGVGVAIVGAIAASTVFIVNRQRAIAAVSVSQSCITPNQQTCEPISDFNRQEIVYRVTLQDAPVGQKLSLQCDWINPNGQIVHQNRYQTSKIDREVWSTYCRHTLGSTATMGDWQVRMRLGDRALDQKSFTVK
ncbi:DUF3859 domain-containing protein [Coleofasciculus sp. E2-BRE-01]|uniref:DUF3859 domain-containing protein n=1 Tax=Coleofasciculus sp. E2-BRE-01 TaxID=3069524 RepID=UPI0032F7FAA8